MYPIFFLKKDKSQKERKKEQTDRVRVRREREKGKKNFASLKDLRKLDRRFLLEQKAKSVHASRATHWYQNLGVSVNSTR